MKPWRVRPSMECTAKWKWERAALPVAARRAPEQPLSSLFWLRQAESRQHLHTARHWLAGQGSAGLRPPLNFGKPTKQLVLWLFLFTLAERMENQTKWRTLSSFTPHSPPPRGKKKKKNQEKEILFQINLTLKEIEFTEQSDRPASCDLATPS